MKMHTSLPSQNCTNPPSFAARQSLQAFDDSSSQRAENCHGKHSARLLNGQNTNDSVGDVQRPTRSNENAWEDEAGDRADGSQHSFPTIDLLYDYGQFLENSAQEGRIGHFPHHATPPKVAIVGSGLAGLVAASELLRAGVTNLTIYESRDRIGGKLWAHKFRTSPHIFAEMGGMRFPSSGTCLFFYLRRHGIVRYSPFPTPQNADTILFYKGEKYLWKKGSDPPGILQRVYRGWQDLLKSGYVSKDVSLAGPQAITRCLKSGHLQQAKDLWQCWLDHFGHESFSSGIERIFTGNKCPGGEPWVIPDDMELFKAFGIGTGGFGPIFESGFVEILRIIVNGYEEGLKFLLEGTSALLDGLASQNINGLNVGERICFEEVTLIEKEESRVRLTLKNGHVQSYDRVIVTTGFASIQLKHCLTSNASLLSPRVCHAIESSHVTASSKLYVLTKSKFWLQHNIPACVLTTGVAKQAYCLDYEPHNPRGNGLVLLSYTWESDSSKLLSVTDKKERLEVLRRDLANTVPEFAANLVPANENYDENVVQHDWLTDPHSGGAFKLNRRGQDALSRDLFFQSLESRRSLHDKGLYLAGCGCSFTGGWAEGAVQTALNAACAVIYNSGGTLVGDNPLQHDWCQYNYGAR